MKKNKITTYIASLIAIIAITATTITWNEHSSFVIDSSLFSIEAIAQSESGGSCKWKFTDCPGFNNGDYEACLSNGDGNSCTCGQVSRDCPN